MNRTTARLSVATAAIALAAFGTAGCSKGTDSATAAPAMVPAGNTSSLKPSPAAKKSTKTTIVYFKIVQKPKCPEGTAVFRADAVPLIISWKVTGATGVGLSVDDPKLPASYNTYAATGTETFTFACGGPVGSVETHEYTITTMGGKQTKRADFKASAKVLDAGLGTN